VNRLGAALLLLSLSMGVAGAAPQVAAPLGLELGKASCADLERAAGQAPSGGDKVSLWGGGPVVEVRDVGRLQLEGLQRATAICDANQKILLLVLQLPKGGMSSEALQATATQLDKKYQVVRRNLPMLGNGSAEWRASNAVIEIDAPHLSFEFELRYWAPGAREAFRKWQDGERRQREQKKAGSL